MSEPGPSSLDALRSQPIGEGPASTIEPAKLAAYRRAFDDLPAAEQDACLDRLLEGHSYEQIASDLGEASSLEAKRTVSRGLDRLLPDVFEGAALQSARLADLLGKDAPPAGDTWADGAPGDMSAAEAAIIQELVTLAKSEPTLRTWDKFTDLQKIGTGGFGTVYSAWHPDLHTRVALKVYHARREQRSTEELLDEARKLARVRHPNVVVVHDAKDVDGRVGVLMELIDGETLEHEVLNGSELDADAAAEVGVALCQALEAVHAAGIVHGDIKAQNVMRGNDGRIVLMDFGAARFRDPRKPEASDTRSGTPVYMAPELFTYRGDRLVEPTVQSDVYAVGVLLFFLVTKEHPVTGRSAKAVNQALNEGHVVLLREANPDLPHQFVSVVEKALARTPAQRQLSARALADELNLPGQATSFQVLTRLATFALIALVAIGTLGFIASRAFEVFLNIPRDLAADVSDYFVVGRQALIPLLIYAAGISIILGMLEGLRRFALWLVRRTNSSSSRGERPRRARLSVEPNLAAVVVFLAGTACWLGITWRFADIFLGLAALRELPTTSADLSVLSSAAEEYQMSHTEYSAYLVVLLGVVIWKWFPDWERRAQDVSTVRLMKWASLAVVFVALSAAVVPHRVLWGYFDVVQYHGEEVFVVGSSDEERMLFDPHASEQAHWSVPAGDPDLLETGETRKLFQ